MTLKCSVIIDQTIIAHSIVLVVFFFSIHAMLLQMQEGSMDWSSYEERISPLERASIHAAPVRQRPFEKEPFTYFPAEIVTARWKAHGQVPFIAESFAKGYLDLEVVNYHFSQCLVIACFELRHRLVESWPAFALLFHKMFGSAVLPWLPSLFLAAVGQAHIPRPQFELEEVLNFHTCHPVASNRIYG
jgi:hypothetical protein